MKYEGCINGYPVYYENNLELWDKDYLQFTYYEVRKCLMLLPPSITRKDFLKGMMRLTRGHLNPKIVLEVYDENREVKR